MRHLTHRSNAHPAQIGSRERRRAQESSRKIIEGQKVHLSGRSMWRGYWYGKGAIAKWNRAEQVLTGMKWSYYTGRQMHVSQISLLETHHSMGATALKGVEAEKNDGVTHSAEAPRHAKGAARINPECGFGESAGHAHGEKGENAHPRPRMHVSSVSGFARPEMRNGASICASGGEKIALADRPQSMPDIPAIAPPTAPGFVSGASDISITPSARPSAGGPVSPGIEAPPAADDSPQIQNGSSSSPAPGQTQPASAGLMLAAGDTRAYAIAFSEAASSAINAIFLLAGLGAKGQGKRNAEGMRFEGGGKPSSAPQIAGARIGLPAFPGAREALENEGAAGAPSAQCVPHGEIPKRRVAQLKVARADATPPQ